MDKKEWLILSTSGIAALIISFFDIVFNKDQSLAVKIGEVVRIYFFKGWDGSIWAGLVIIILVAIFFTHLKNPYTKWESAQIGFSIISIITTIASPLKQDSVSHLSFYALPISNAYAQNAITENKSKSETTVKIITSDYLNNANIQIRDALTDKIVRTLAISSTNKILIDSLNSNSEYIIYIESSGKRWTKVKVKPKNENEVIKIKTTNSKTPMFFQRFMGATEVQILE